MKDNIYYANKYSSMYMKMAEVCAEESKAKKRKVGCVVLLKDLTLLHGFNGTPSGSPSDVCEGTLGETLPHVLHAEENALHKALETDVDIQGGVVFTTTSPCVNCCKKLYNAGARVVYYREWYHSIDHIPHFTKLGMKFFQI